MNNRCAFFVVLIQENHIHFTITVQYFVTESEGQEMNESFSQVELLKLLSRLDVLTKEADEVAASAHRINAELVLLQRELYQRLNPSAKDLHNEIHA